MGSISEPWKMKAAFIKILQERIQNIAEATQIKDYTPLPKHSLKVSTMEMSF